MRRRLLFFCDTRINSRIMNWSRIIIQLKQLTKLPGRLRENFSYEIEETWKKAAMMANVQSERRSQDMRIWAKTVNKLLSWQQQLGFMELRCPIYGIRLCTIVAWPGFLSVEYTLLFLFSLCRLVPRPQMTDTAHKPPTSYYITTLTFLNCYVFCVLVFLSWNLFIVTISNKRFVLIIAAG